MKEDREIESYDDPKIAELLAKKLQSIKLDTQVTLMHVCGTHEHSISKAGIRYFLPDKLRLVAGPGCPVCVCPAENIDLALDAARMSGVILTTFGDMFRVPSSDKSLEMMKAEGYDIRVVYSPLDAVRTAHENPDREVVFMAVGFETTAGPIAAAAMDDPPNNFSLITSLRLIPPALKYLLSGGSRSLDGFILPGHVSTVIGRRGYDFLESGDGIPASISGFEPVDILHSILELIGQLKNGPPFKVVNLYGRIVEENGNSLARKKIYSVFEESDSSWRGIGTIEASGLVLKKEYEHIDAVRKFNLRSSKRAVDIHPGCICNEVILGDSEPEDCALFGEECTPRNPYGPCMVSSEGTCRARYQYRSLEP